MTTAPLAAAWRGRAHPSYAAFVVHRLSAIGLTLFLPLHFWALSQVLDGEAALDGFLRWTDQPLLKVAETVLVLLLAAHLAGGLRLLALELLGWRDWQKAAVAVSAGFSVAVGLLFLLNVTA
jgi:fumarate reductase subunit D